MPSLDGRRDEKKNRRMKIGIIGASASGIYAALLLSRQLKDAQITLIDRMEKIGKKLYATGNGHCNLMHVPFTSAAFNQPRFVEGLLHLVGGERGLLDTLDSLGIETMAKGELLYPLSYSAPNYVHQLARLLENAHVQVCLEEQVEDLSDCTVKTNKGMYSFDHLIFAFGGASQASLGSDGSMFAVLKNHGYRIASLRPVLCPIKSHDVPKSLFGVRHGVRLTLLQDGKSVYEEVGEVTFKKDGLSGIAVMNASNKARHGDIVSLDLFPELEEEEITGKLAHSYARFSEGFLMPFFDKQLADFIHKKAAISAKKGLKHEDFARIAALIKALRFTVDGFYDFDASQVTRGGVELGQVDGMLRSRINPSHHFVGECLDIDGLCGGYNLGFALLSAMVVAKSFTK